MISIGLHHDVVDVDPDRDRLVARQGPRGGGPDQRQLAGLQPAADGDGGVLPVLVDLVVHPQLVVGQRRLVVPAVGQHPQALVHESLVVQGLERPEHALHEGDVEGLVVVLEVDPAGLPGDVGLPGVGVLQHRGAARGVERLDAHLLDLVLGLQAELGHGLQLGGQPVAVPAEAALDPATAHGLEARHDVLDVAGQQVAVVRQAVGEGRSVVEDELVRSRSRPPGCGPPRPGTCRRPSRRPAPAPPSPGRTGWPGPWSGSDSVAGAGGHLGVGHRGLSSSARTDHLLVRGRCLHRGTTSLAGRPEEDPRRRPTARRGLSRAHPSGSTAGPRSTEQAPGSSGGSPVMAGSLPVPPILAPPTHLPSPAFCADSVDSRCSCSRSLGRISHVHWTRLPHAPGQSRQPIRAVPCSRADRPAQRHALWVYCTDADAAAERLVGAGGTLISPPTDMPWGERVADLHDPDGNLLHVAHSLG